VRKGSLLEALVVSASDYLFLTLGDVGRKKELIINDASARTHDVLIMNILNSGKTRTLTKTMKDAISELRQEGWKRNLKLTIPATSRNG